MTAERTKLRVRDFMTGSPQVISPGASLEEARSQMANSSVRHLPVVGEDGGLVGLVSERDLSLLESLPSIRGEDCEVKDAMRASIFTCGPEAQLHAVAAQMIKHRYGSAVIVDPNATEQVLGIFTTVDALRAIVQLTQPFLVDPESPQ